MTEQQQRVEVALPPDVTAPGSARRAVRELLAAWRLPHLLEPVLLAVSELVTNAVRYGTAPVRLTLRRCSGGVSVGVHDGGAAALAAARLPGAEAESGRGLAIVESVADQTGVRPDGRGGKVVWARIACAGRVGS